MARTARESSTSKLAKFFPDATPIRIPVQLILTNKPAPPYPENTTIEFGTAHEVLFAANLALEFADTLRIRNNDGSLDVEACVVALQQGDGRTAVAARFTQTVPNWIIKS